MSDLTFSVNTLEWAASNIGLQLKDIAGKISDSQRTQQKILEGYLSINQAEELAKKTRVPFGYLFLDNPPALYKPALPDLRQTLDPEPLSLNFFDVLADIQTKQDWYADFLIENGAKPLEFVGKFAGPIDEGLYKLIADDICKTLGLSFEFTNTNKKDEYFQIISEKCESAGILIFRNGIVKNATKKSLDVSEFRGFVLINNYAPAVFINGADAPPAWTFTLVHELAHIWMGESGVIDADPRAHDEIEILCNKVAAEILVPSETFHRVWEIFEENIQAISSFYHVSELMMARVALNHSKISYSTYKNIESITKERLTWGKAKKDNGGNFLANIPIRNSRKLTKTVVNQAASGEMLLRDAGRLLNVSPQNIMELSRST